MQILGENLISRYATRPGAYADFYEVSVDGEPDLERFLRTFFDTWVFRLERRVLRLLKYERTDRADVLAIAAGKSDSFAAWEVEERREREVIFVFAPPMGRTWLGVSDAGGTKLQFGSALIPREGERLPWYVRATIPFHRLYSRTLLSAAARAWSRG
ncbi:MAG: hypothetical protein AAGF13_01325 [Pseudomonadota bacterium]